MKEPGDSFSNGQKEATAYVASLPLSASICSGGVRRRCGGCGGRGAGLLGENDRGCLDFHMRYHHRQRRGFPAMFRGALQQAQTLLGKVRRMEG